MGNHVFLARIGRWCDNYGTSAEGEIVEEGLINFHGCHVMPRLCRFA